jgi:hypothetical protein
MLKDAHESFYPERVITYVCRYEFKEGQHTIWGYILQFVKAGLQ